MELLKNLLYYPIIIFFDIIEFFYKIISNILFKIKKKDYSYDDIVSIEYVACMPPDFESINIYESDVYKSEEDIDYKEVGLKKEEFNKIKELLKDYEIFKYNNIFKFSFTPFSELFVDDGGDGEEILTIYMKNSKQHKISVSCYSKWFSDLVEKLHKL